MHPFFTRPSVRRAVVAVVTTTLLSQPATVWGQAAMLSLVNTPLFVAPPIAPLVMLDISKDQQLYKKAYNDYSDLDGDGQLETSYKHSIDYYGYFDAYKCYDYGTTAILPGFNYFIPDSYTTDKYCDGTKWSGNFLNWMTMSRIDAVRKLLFGGMRRIDLQTGPGGYGATTMLERSHIPTDAHAWAKWYGGTDLPRLTPFNVTVAPTNPDRQAPFTTTTAVDVNAVGVVRFDNVPAAFLDTLAYGDQIVGTTTAVAGGPFTKTGRLVNKGKAAAGSATGFLEIQIDVGGNFITIDYGVIPPTGTLDPPAAPPPAGTTTTGWELINLSSTGASFCNVTPRDGGNQYSHTNTFTPRMRMVRGNFELWASNERRQCGWYDEFNNLQGGFGLNRSSNGNQAGLSGLNASAENPPRNAYTINNSNVPSRAIGSGIDSGEFRVMVVACHNAFTPAPIGQPTTEKCKQYDQLGFYKPIGLLQVYGDDNRINFGLMTGSYSRNISGGVLRKNTTSMNDEIDASGRFVASPPNGSIVRTLSRLRMYGYDYNDGTYIGVDGNCTYQLTSTDLTDGRCRTWGNPMSEIYAESLRYFAGATAPTAGFNTDDSGLISGLTTATWPNPNNVLTNANYCAPLNILVFNSSVSSKDHDQVPNPFGGAIPGFSAATATTAVGNAEGLGSGTYFIGNDGVTNDSLCGAKSGGAGGFALGNVQGICPEAPSLNGTYLMAGLAHAARTNRIRSDLTVPATDKTSLKVSTYGISLATNVPRIEIPVPGGAAGQKVIIQPVYRLTLGGGRVGSGAIVDVKIVRMTATSGRMYVNWEDSEQGGDYDQDVWGVIDWQISAGTINVATNVISAATANPQGFGYVISGTTADGPHFHSGIYNFNFNDPTNPVVRGGTASAPGAVLGGGGTAGTFINATGGCLNCTAANPTTVVTYTISAAGSGRALQDPLWFASKYGGFKDSGNLPPASTPLPDVQSEWDSFNNATGALGPDGLPDNFFLVSNPLGLEASLDKLFISILQSAAASAVAANSSRLNTSTRIYQAVFNPSDWSGKLNAIALNQTTGQPASTPDWDAGLVSLGPTTVNPGGRVILTYNKGLAGAAPRGIPFVWPANPGSPTASELTPGQIVDLHTNPDTSVTDGLGQLRLNYLRGDAANEGLASTNFRRRPLTKLGDIINSNPNFVGAPSAGFPDPTYVAFASTNASRRPMIYIGANDGMLHAFDASATSSAGTELLAFVPSTVFRNLSRLTSRSYNSAHRYFVDGSPVVEDAYLTGAAAWKTVLVGGLNKGGQGIYALDVTNPTNFTTGNAANLVLWEFTDADDPDLGFTFGNPVIRRMSNGRFAAIVSGGYNNSQGSAADPREIQCTSGLGTQASPYAPTGCTVSRTGEAYIFVLYLDGPTGPNGSWQLGTDYFKLSTGTGSTTAPNGLASPFAADVDGNGAVDFVYAGDLNGDLWKFDLRGASSTWGATTNRVRLFQARDASNNIQPITSGVEATLHPSGNGIIVSFGTGKYLESNDVTPPGPAYRTQTLYGIWDLNDSATISGQSTVSGRSVLMEQLLQPGITNFFTLPDGSIVRITTRHRPNYTTAARDDSASYDGMGGAVEQLIEARGRISTTPASQRGWYLDLLNGAPAGAPSGERNIFAPLLRNGIILFSTMWPINDVCLGSTAGDNLTLQIATGARPDSSVFDTNNDYTVNSSDMVTPPGAPATVRVAVSSRRIPGGSAQPPTLIAVGGQTTTGVGQGGGVVLGAQNTTGGGPPFIQFYKFGKGPGTVTWREILY
ncbi:MAG: hypothetical protein JNM79_17720 [Burkholderiales bacterium]|nr:hypothetical protein [Burkholderiales bacterium]